MIVLRIILALFLLKDIVNKLRKILLFYLAISEYFENKSRKFNIMACLILIHLEITIIIGLLTNFNIIIVSIINLPQKVDMKALLKSAALMYLFLICLLVKFS